MDKAARRYAAVLLAAFIFLFCANTLFIHTHVADDGVYVVHSHPFLPHSSHTHSTQALQVISLANAAMFLLDMPQPAAVTDVQMASVRLSLPKHYDYFQYYSFSVAGRAPPRLLLSANRPDIINA